MLNRFAYLTSDLVIKALSRLSKARIYIHGQDHIPNGTNIFVINHFTRIETMLLPSYIYRLTHRPIWSLGDYELFQGGMKYYFDKVGVVSTKAPDRDQLIVKTLLSGDASWIIFPEGRMVKTKKTIEKNRFMVSAPSGKHPPHTGAATLALRTEFYRQRLALISKTCPDEAKRLMDLYQLEGPLPDLTTHIVPVNITYYPLRSHENILNKLAAYYIEDLSQRATEEIMTEGTMLLAGVDMDIRFGKPIKAAEYLDHPIIQKDMASHARINFDDSIPSRKIMRRQSKKLMQTYMHAIYMMTTVNHDHLFASVLKNRPFKKIKVNDLKARVFLAALYDYQKMGCYCHTSLNIDQLALITDDRYQKYQAFIKLAQEKKVVTLQEDVVTKNPAKFPAPFTLAGEDWHTARSDNPIAVMVNEIEPLKPLQQALRQLAWRPAFMVRNKIADRLREQAQIEFENDYQKYFIEGESKEKAIGSPFLIKGRSKDIGVILIHGYMAAPLEVARLAVHLGRMGFWVYVPRLQGHGTAPEDLATRSYHDWIKSVDLGYAIISNTCRKIFAGGFSTGAALALELAARIKTIQGVFAICPPLQLQNFGAKLAPAVDTWNRLLHKLKIDGFSKEFVENRPENPHINYLRNPIAGVREIELLMDHLEPQLPQIQSPAVVVQGYNDPVVNCKGSRRIFELIGSEDKEYQLFNFNHHCIVLGQGSQRVYQVVGAFINRIMEK